MATKIILSGISLICILITGFWMSKLGRPYQAVLFNLHKFITLAAILLTVMAVLTLHKETGLSAIQLTIVVGTAVVLAMALASGGILSAKETTIPLILLAHRISAALTLIGAALLYFYLFRMKA